MGSDYTIFAHIEKVEPAVVSRITSGEVEVDFINDFEEHLPEIAPEPEPVPEVAHIPAPIPVPEETLTAEERRRQAREARLKRFC